MMSEEIVVKRVRTADEQLIPTLFRLGGMEEGQANPAFFEDPANIFLVAYEGGTPLGFLYGYVLQVVNRERPLAFLYSIDTFAPMRRRGAGRAMLEEFRRLAMEESCSEVFVLTNASNQVAMEFYAQTGGRRENPDDVLFVYPL